MRVGDYVVYGGTAWRVIKRHIVGTYQIKTLYPLPSCLDNIEVDEKDCGVITKEVADVFIASNTYVTNN
jgi:hypothetical protein